MLKNPLRSILDLVYALAQLLKFGIIGRDGVSPTQLFHSKLHTYTPTHTTIKKQEIDACLSNLAHSIQVPLEHSRTLWGRGGGKYRILGTFRSAKFRGAKFLQFLRIELHL